MPANVTELHLPALQVVVPLVAAPVAVLVRSREVAWWLAMAASVAALAIAAALLAAVLDGGTVSYLLGGWMAPWGIEYRIDTANAFVLVLVALVGSVSLAFARDSAAAEIEADNGALFYCAWLLCLAGLLGITITGDVFNLFVFLEISSLSSYVLISQGRDRRALLASFQYLVLGTLGASFLLIGVGMLYMMTGTLNMVDLAQRLPAVAHTRTVAAAFVFLVVGVGLKMALFPLHTWLPNAYTYAPSSVSVLLAATATKVAVYVLARFMFTVFGFDYTFSFMGLHVVLVPLALAAIIIMSLAAIVQQDAKRMLACSSVAQIGYMTLGLGLATAGSLSAAFLHLFNHALMKGTLFMALGCVFYRLGTVRVRDMAGLGRHMPWTMAAFVAGGMSLIGIPLTAGFISKWYLVLAAIELGRWSSAAIVLIGSLLALVYVGRVVEIAYFRERPADADPVTEAPMTLLVPTWLLVAANFYFGIDTRLTVGAASDAARTLLGGLP